MSKRFHIDGSDIKAIATGRGACIATDRITVDGLGVGYMYREAPDNNIDSGWRFFHGDEDDEYIDNSKNSGIYDVNTVANYTPEIIPFLDAPTGSAFYREGETFIPDPLGPATRDTLT